MEKKKKKKKGKVRGFRLPEGVEIVPMRRRGGGAWIGSDHENRGGEREAKGGEAEEEDEGVEAAELVYCHGGVEVRRCVVRSSRRRWEITVATERWWVLAVTEGLRGSHAAAGSSSSSRRRCRSFLFLFLYLWWWKWFEIIFYRVWQLWVTGEGERFMRKGENERESVI